MIDFCFNCRSVKALRTCEGWIFDRQIKHERCETCRCLAGPTLHALLSSRATNEPWAALLLARIALAKRAHEETVRGAAYAAASGAGAER